MGFNKEGMQHCYSLSGISFQINIWKGPEEWVLLELEGDLDAAFSDDHRNQVFKQLDRMVEEGSRGLVADLSKVGYTDSSGAKLLFRIALTKVDSNLSFLVGCLVAPNSQVGRVLQFLTANTGMAIFQTEEELRSALRERLALLKVG